MKLNHTFSILKPTVLRALLPAVMLLSSCEKVLDIDLKEAEPRVIIEANVSDQPGPYSVIITRSVSFNETNNFPTVNGAEVILSDNAGNSETLTETAPGVYKTAGFQGVPGRNYFLKIKANGQEYDAVSSMPQPIAIQELKVQKSTFGGDRLMPIIKFQDPPETGNYYRAFYIVNGKASNRLLYLDDDNHNGNIIEGNFFDPDIELKSGDVVTIVLQTINEKMYRFLREEDMSGSSQAASPANPTSHFSNNALGYFSTHGQTSATVTVP
ncbi:DUF4249 domain-containing protein [Adhaeribacter soli]|uniref:DUF4249 domain-containing protein n=1 Tax=Adhaeribacter soli TaxID=2607655 RepID=A0A5N1J9I6_9BACT|nr:DUF4249 domain-containing protein [Adhaeribacter soli]KAA9345658.1 DUF4249 domain-containing protein [Adhaeribacter soli]